MKYRKLGNTGCRVSEISLGSWLTYAGYVEQQTAAKIIHTAYEAGINFFDTANVYMKGEAEKVVGEALRSFPRSSYVLATKVYFPMGDRPNESGLSRKHVMEQAHASLERLGVDYIDLYYCHRFDEDTPVRETLQALDDLIRQGKILYAGVSEWSATQIEQALELADQFLLDRIVVNQPRYNMFNRYIENEVLPVSEKYGIGQVTFSPLANGVLTGKYKTGEAPPEGSRAKDPKSQQFINRYLTEENLLKVKKLKEIARAEDLSMVQLALAWVLRHKNVSSALTGASKPEQIVESAKASGVELSDESLEAIEEILSGS